ncbi:AraC family transcriptional regulator [Rhodobacteraceae bacterium RKSG542]|uniref:AraC family transcriptional regulator n=1 Tax=Pseudovibrio flavus TaxID=2529854 RepID=UPI0012BCCA25|nr:helix-turn-helix transcriptional regulator [Pseudovibrio flavus]MTI19248.1 AraC family transcriptional regulator [Pseudovibrio flavus]
MPVIHPDVLEAPDHDSDTPIIAYAKDLAGKENNDWHHHARGQLLHITKGSLVVQTAGGTFVVPPERAVWVPGNMEHRTIYPTYTEFRTLYVREDWCSQFAAEPIVVQVTPLLRELIMALMGMTRHYDEHSPAGRLARVLLDQMALLPTAPLQLTFPSNEKLKGLADRIVECPAHIPSVATAAASCALSQRTFERRFSAETGISYRRWCNQAKLFRALELLAADRTVSDVSHKLGYEGPSAFIATFKKAFGVTPGQYFREKE